MPKIKIVVQHTIEQITILDIPEDELEELTYEDALVNCIFDELKPSMVEITEIVGATIDGNEHYFK